jgi:hypothetical protein
MIKAVMDILNSTYYDRAFESSLLDTLPIWNRSPTFYVLSAFLTYVTFQITASALYGGKGNAEVSVPIVGPKNVWQARYTFFKNASYYVEKGYAQVGWPENCSRTV